MQTPVPWRGGRAGPREERGDSARELRKEGVLGSRGSWRGAARSRCWPGMSSPRSRCHRGGTAPLLVSPSEGQPRVRSQGQRGGGAPGPGVSAPSPRAPGSRCPVGAAVLRALPRGDDGRMALARPEEAQRRGRYRGAPWVSPLRLPN